MNGFTKARRAAVTGVLAALSLIMFLIESLFPPLILPGAKMGIANIFVLLALVCFGAGEAFAVLSVKILLGNLVAGNFSTLMYSLPAGVLSLLAMSFLFFGSRPRFGIAAISVAGAVVHNVAQNVVYSLVTRTSEILSMLPYLALLGVLSGVIVGVAVFLLLRLIPAAEWERLLSVS